MNQKVKETRYASTRDLKHGKSPSSSTMNMVEAPLIDMENSPMTKGGRHFQSFILENNKDQSNKENELL
jgi:hypothetical protein